VFVWEDGACGNSSCSCLHRLVATASGCYRAFLNCSKNGVTHWRLCAVACLQWSGAGNKRRRKSCHYRCSP